MTQWRLGLFALLLFGSWLGWAWMLLAVPSLRASLTLLLAVTVGLTGGVFLRYRESLTLRLVTSYLALASVLHAALAGAVVAAERLYALGVLPALQSNWHHFLVGGLGLGVATFSWSLTRGQTLESPLQRPVSPGDPEPAPAAVPELAQEPDWEGLAAQLAGKRDGPRLRQLDALERISAVLGGEGPPEERIAAAQRILRQLALRLSAEAEAEEAEEDDLLSSAASLLEWGTQKLPELADLDLSDLLMAKAVADIRSLSVEVQHCFVDHRELRAIHPIDRPTAEEKCNERAEAARRALPLLRANGMRLSEDLISARDELQPFQSVTGFQVVRLDDGFVTFEGNGRREALQRAFGAEEGIQVEVRLYRFDDAETEAAIQRRVARVRRWKQVED